MKNFYLQFSPDGDAGSAGGPAVADPGPSGEGSPSGASVVSTEAAPSSAPVPVAAKSYYGQDGKFTPDFAKDYPELAKKHPDFDGLLKAHVNQSKLIGAKGVIHPGPNATPEQKAEFYRQLGRPDKAEAYELGKIEKIKVGDREVPVADEFKGDFQKMVGDSFLEAGINKEQGKVLMEKFLSYSMDRKAAFEANGKQSTESAYRTLEQSWGPRSGSQWKENEQFARDAATKLGMTVEEMGSSPVANDPIFLRMLARYGAQTKESPAAGARGNHVNGTVDAKSEIEAINSNKEHIYWANSAAAKANPKGHEEAKRYKASLHEKLVAQRGGQ